VAAHAATHPSVPLPTLADELRETRDRLDTLTTDDPHTDVRAVLSWSYRALTPAAARLFRLLGLHPGPDVTAPAAASLAGLPARAVRPLLAELARAHLIVEHAAGRYTFHDLLRAYAADLAEQADSDTDRHAAVHRMLDHYLHTASTAARQVEPVRWAATIILVPPQPGVSPERPADSEQALAWLTAEHTVLLGAVDQATRAGFDTHTWQLASTLLDFLGRRGHWRDWLNTALDAVTAADRLGDPAAQAQANIDYGSALLQADRVDEAGTYLRRGLELSIQVGDLIGQGRAYFNLSWLAELRGDLAGALHDAERGLELYRVAGDRQREARGLGTVVWVHARLGEHEQARIFGEQSVALCAAVGDRQGEAHAWDTVGYADGHLGRFARAVDSYQHALKLFRDAGLPYNEAVALMYLGDIHLAAGDPDAARTVWRQGLTLLDELDHADADQIRRRLTDLETGDRRG
jgi:tetratricopeptide (TPR) repeat protein